MYTNPFKTRSPAVPVPDIGGAAPTADALRALFADCGDFQIRVLRLGLEVAPGAGVYFAALGALLPDARGAILRRLLRRRR